MRPAVSALTTGLARRARETVEWETPTRRAMSLIETILVTSYCSHDHSPATGHRLHYPDNSALPVLAGRCKNHRERGASSTRRTDGLRFPGSPSGPAALHGRELRSQPA